MPPSLLIFFSKKKKNVKEISTFLGILNVPGPESGDFVALVFGHVSQVQG